MPVPPVLPPAPPPPPPRLIPPVAPPPLQPKLARPLLLAVIGVGLVQLLLVLIAPNVRAVDDAAYRTGAVLGATIIWPLLVIGLFSIGRRFRNAQSRAVILLTVWGLFILSHLAQLSLQRKQMRLSGPDRATSLLQNDTGNLFSAPTTTSFNGGPTFAVPAQPAASVSQPEDPAYDFSRGSDERLIKLIENAQEQRYHAVVAAYANECAGRPTDADLALERVKFIERFAYAEDVEIESASRDLETAVNELKRRFPNAPQTALYEMRSIYSPDFESTAQRYAGLVTRWDARDRAQFYLLRANAAEHKGNATRVKHFAKLSFDADPTVDAALLLAARAHAEEKPAECLEYLRHEVFERAQPWQKKSQMDLLFDAGDVAPAVALYDELASGTPYLVNNTETATRLAKAGRVEAARTLLHAIPVNEWNRAVMLRKIFEFELETDSAEHALDAYRALRETGFLADPMLRDRFALFWKHPGLAWNFHDVLGVALVVLAVALVAFAPLLVLLPVHYWSMLRERRGKSHPSRIPGWGLRQAWIALGVMCVADLVAIWIYQPEVMRTWWSDAELEMVLDGSALIRQQLIAWSALIVILALLLWGADKWRLLGPGRWGFGKSIGVALLSTLGLWILIFAYALVWPPSLGQAAANIDSYTFQLCLALLKNTGPLGMIGVLAILVPILEELLFRGVLLQAFSKHLTFGWANVLQALAFAAVHENLRFFPFFVCFALVAGFLARKSGGLLSSILMHGCHNFLVSLGIWTLHRMSLV